MTEPIATPLTDARLMASGINSFPQAYAEMATHARALERDRARLVEALKLVFETREQEAKAALSARNAAENFSHPAPEFAAHARAAVAASVAEQNARALLSELSQKEGVQS